MKRLCDAEPRARRNRVLPSIGMGSGRLFDGSAAVILAISLCNLALTGCNGDLPPVVPVVGGDPQQGRIAIDRYGCPSCHTIPRVSGAVGLVGPPLAGIASRMYIAGVLSNTPDNMIRWLRNPPAIDPLTAMPNMNVTEPDARNIASFLYTLR